MRNWKSVAQPRRQDVARRMLGIEGGGQRPRDEAWQKACATIVLLEEEIEKLKAPEVREPRYLNFRPPCH